MKRVAFLMIFALLFAACADPKVDASTDKSMETSLEKVRESLPVEDRAKFDEAVSRILVGQFDFSDALKGGDFMNRAEQRMRTALHEKTAAEILAEASRIEAEIERKKREQAIAEEARRRAQAMEEINELEQKLIASKLAAENLAGFKILRSRFYMKKRRYTTPTPTVELSVRNDTPSPISRAYFHGVLASPERSVPWNEGDFNYSIPGGLEPGETADWVLTLYSFSWMGIEAPPGAVFTVTVERLDGPDGEPLWDIDDFTEEDAAKLAELKRTYAGE